jgi:anti-sigma28 factor (negative regulator of flagellin synthesis)
MCTGWRMEAHVPRPPSLQISPQRSAAAATTTSAAAASSTTSAAVSLSVPLPDPELSADLPSLTMIPLFFPSPARPLLTTASNLDLSYPKSPSSYPPRHSSLSSTFAHPSRVPVPATFPPRYKQASSATTTVAVSSTTSAAATTTSAAATTTSAAASTAFVFLSHTAHEATCGSRSDVCSLAP